MGTVFMVVGFLMMALAIMQHTTFELRDESVFGVIFFIYGIIFLALAISLLRKGLPSGLEAFEDEPLL